MHPSDAAVLSETRRQFFARGARGLGRARRSPRLLGGRHDAARRLSEAVGGLPGLPHFAPKAKRCIYLHLVGAPPQMDISITSRR